MLSPVLRPSGPSSPGPALGLLAGAILAFGLVACSGDDYDPTAPEPTTVGDEATPSTERAETERAETERAETERAEDDPQAVRDVLDRYQEAVTARDGAGAVELVTEGTLEWYDGLLDLAVTADGDQLVSTVPLADALTVVAARGRYGQELLTIEDGRDLFVRGVAEGATSPADTSIIERFEIDGDEALGYVGGQPLFRFEYDGGWRLDAEHLATRALESEDEAAVLAAIGGPDVSDRADLFELLAAGYGTTWDELSPPLR